MKLRILFSILLGLAIAKIPPADAQMLMGSKIQDADKADFVSYFRFKPKQTLKNELLTEHLYANDGGCLLGLGVNSDGKILHLKLIMDRELIDKLDETVLGRDVERSFISALTQDPLNPSGEFTPLMDEIWIRGLDLHPVETNAAKFADSGKPVPKNAYKIGTGPSKAGDRLVFIDKMPTLAAKPSEMFEAFIGKIPAAGIMGTKCRFSFQNKSAQNQKVLITDAWDELFWQQHLEPKKEQKPRSAAMNDALKKAKDLSQARKWQEVINLLKPLNAKESDQECLKYFGTALEETGHHSDAAFVLKKACDLENANKNWSADLHLLYAKALMNSGKEMEAVNETTAAQEINSKDPKVLLDSGLVLITSENHVINNMARVNFVRAEKAGSTDYRLKALQALASIKMGNIEKGLAALDDAISKISDKPETHNFLSEIKSKRDKLQTIFKAMKPAPVPAKDRKYTMPQGMAAVFADIDQTTGINTLGLNSNHDPDNGAQDGNDDGIIQVLQKNMNQPAEVYRPPN